MLPPISHVKFSLAILFMMMITDRYQTRGTNPSDFSNEDGQPGDPVYNVCPSINKYLQATYICRPREFMRQIVCAGDKTELRCGKTTVIAILSAAYGWSSVEKIDCSSRLSDRPGCPLTCVTRDILGTCQGKRKCTVEASDAVFSSYRCSISSPLASRYLGVMYTCLTRSVLRQMDSPDGKLENPCDDIDNEFDNHDGWHSQFSNNENNNSAFASTITTTLPTTTSTTAAFTTSTMSRIEDHYQPERFLKTPARNSFQTQTIDRIALSPSTLSTTTRSREEDWQFPVAPIEEVGEVRTVASFDPKSEHLPASDATSFLQTISDWLWVWRFVNGNLEKFILYLSLSLSVGIITVLLAIVVRLVLRSQFGRRCKQRLTPNEDEMMAHQGTITMTGGSPTWRVPESESSTGDDRTLHDEDVEMNSFNHIDSLSRRAAYHPHPYPSTTGGQQGGQQTPSLAVQNQPPTAATINRSYTQANPISARCPGSPPLAPATINGGFMTQQPCRQGSITQAAPSSSLGRTHTSRFGPEAYHLQMDDGSRTLQPLTHYYG